MTTTRTHDDESDQRRNAIPLSLLISTIREIGGNSKHEAQHKAAFKRLLSDLHYEDFRDALIDEWISIKYSTALAAANPPTTAQLRQKVEAGKAAHDRDVGAIKAKIKGRILHLLMPNGKRLADCTGTECVEFGGWYVAIGERVGANSVVGRVLTESEVLRLLARL